MNIRFVVLQDLTLNHSVVVGWYTAAADWGTQGPSDAAIHAMTPPYATAGARADWGQRIDSNLSSGTYQGIGNALHAVQDAEAAGHANFARYDGILDLVKNNPSPIVGDWLPSQSSINRASKASSNLMKRIDRCVCKNSSASDRYLIQHKRMQMTYTLVRIVAGAIVGAVGIVLIYSGVVGLLTGVHGGWITSLILMVLGWGPTYIAIILVNRGIRKIFRRSS